MDLSIKIPKGFKFKSSPNFSDRLIKMYLYLTSYFSYLCIYMYV